MRSKLASKILALSYLIVWVPGATTAAHSPQPNAAAAAHSGHDAPWSAYGADSQGTRFSTATALRPENIAGLREVWRTQTGALRDHRPWQERASFEATPVLFRDTLYLSTPFDQVLALDPASGVVRWRFDPHINNPERGVITSRGVAVWAAQESRSSPRPVLGDCNTRVFLATLDARLLALDARSGTPCPGFGERGTVDLKIGVDFRPGDEFGVTSAPTVVGDIVLTGSAIGDNRRVDAERGLVRAFDARSGRLLWSWNPLPWAESAHLRTGGANAWSTLSADPEHGIVYLPTSSPSPDFFGGLRPGVDRDADSLVALDIHTGRKLWSFQVVHHNLWDYDLAAQPLLFRFRGQTPAVAIATKLGTVFVLNGLTGEPLFPVSERAVPRTDVPGETSSPTQPMSALPPLTPSRLSPDQAWGPTPDDRDFCRTKLSELRNEGAFTPPSVRGSLLYPGSLGGVNWGSTAFDPITGTLYANSNNQPFLIRLGPRHESWWHDNITLPLSSWLNEIGPRWIRHSRLFRWVLSRFYPDEGFQPDPERKISNPHFGKEYSIMGGTPYTLVREPLTSPSGLPCSPPPWGTLSALNLNQGTLLWQKPLGTMAAGIPGSLTLGGPIVTAGGLVFTAAAKDPHIRAFDAHTGQLLWTGDLPVPAQATPMTYTYGGRQFLVIAAGGHGPFGSAQGDSVIAFALSAPPAR